jgi:WD40 repeat protein
MAEGDIEQRINQAQYAATSATGSAVINISNYFYHEDGRLAPVKPADTSFDNRPCPYRGLYHFNPNDAELFFGRDSQVEELVKATAKRNFIPILGASGSGKSSLVFAGLVPELQKQGNWLFTHFSLGSNPDPFYALAQALVPFYRSEQDSTDEIIQAEKLAKFLNDGLLEDPQRITKVFTRIQRKHPQHKLLLIADQFEQLYTSGKDEAKRNRFLDCLLSIIQSPTNNSLSTVLVTTMRADFLDDALSYRPFADALQNTDIKLGPMNRKEREQVIKEPALKRGVTFQEGLVNRILDDVDNEPGHLPLLEFALMLLWEKRTERRKQQTEQQLIHADYEAIGKVKGALAKYANNIYENFKKTQQKKVQKIFAKLVHFTQFTKDRADSIYVSKVAKKTDFSEEDWHLVEVLADKRLVVTNRNADGEDTVEIIHEALIHEWTLLREWIKNDSIFLTWRDQLRRDMDRWRSEDKDEGRLLRGKPLDIAEEWLQTREADLEAEQEYIKVSLGRRDRDKEKEKRDQAEKILFQRRFIWALSGGFAIALIAAVAAAWQWRHSEGQRRTAEVERSSLSALQKVENAPIAALVLAMESGKDLKDLVKDRLIEEYPTVSPLFALQTILDNIHLENQFYTKQQGVNSVIFDKHKQQIVTAGEDGTVRVFDFYGEKLKNEKLKDEKPKEFKAHKGGVSSVRFLDKDKKTLVTGGKDGTAKLWDLSSPTQWPKPGKKFQHCNPHDQKKCGVNNVRTPNHNPKIIATSGDDGTLRLWNLQGNQLSKVQAHQDSIESINFSPDDKLIATAGKDGVARLWQLNGNQINKKPVAEFKGHQGSVNSIFFSPNGTKIATAGDDGTVRVWNLHGKELGKIIAHIGNAKAVRFSPTDDKLLATAGTDGTVRLWSLNSDFSIEYTPLAEFKGHQGRIESIRFSEDGKTIISSGADDGTVKIWTVAQKQFRQIFKEGHQDSVNSVRFSPDGNYIATAGDDNKVILWQRNGEISQRFSHPKKVKSVRFSPTKGKKLLATAGEDGKVRLWDFDGNKKKEFDARHGIIESVNFSNDGKFLATAGDDMRVKLWRLNGDLEHTLEHTFVHDSKVKSVRFSPRDNLLATVGEGGTAWLWNIQNQWKVKLDGHTDTVYGVSFSEDGKEVFTAGDDGFIRRWDLNGKPLPPEVKAYQTSVRNISFSFRKDRNLLATVGAGGTVKVWTSSGKQVAEFEGHQGIVKSAAFSDDGKWLATAGDDCTAIVWPVRNLDELLKEGCTWLKDYLYTHEDQKDKELKELKSFCDSK